MDPFEFHTDVSVEHYGMYVYHIYIYIHIHIYIYTYGLLWRMHPGFQCLNRSSFQALGPGARGAAAASEVVGAAAATFAVSFSHKNSAHSYIAHIKGDVQAHFFLIFLFLNGC